MARHQLVYTQQNILLNLSSGSDISINIDRYEMDCENNINSAFFVLFSLLFDLFVFIAGCIEDGGTRRVTVMVVVNEHGTSSSKPGRGCLCLGESKVFGSVSLFTCISTFLGYFMLKPSLQKNISGGPGG